MTIRPTLRRRLEARHTWLISLCAAWLALLAPMTPCLAQQNDVADKATVAEQPNAQALTLSVVDANPMFLGGVALPVDSAGEVHELTKAGTTRKGLAADGETLLLLRVDCPTAGTVEFELAGEEPRGEILSARSLTPATRIDTVRDEWHVALAVYRAPPEFGAHDGFSRELKIECRFAAKAAENQATDREVLPDKLEAEATLHIVRPPVVLVHGMYDNPHKHWEARPPAELGTQSMREALEERGFRVFLCDYESTNGKTFGGPSRLRDNDHVLWGNPGGIKAALANFRSAGYAVTQADVIGHSMGGLLARAYIRGRPIPQESPLPDLLRLFNFPERKTESTEDWYRRPDNFQAGDVNRLITLATAHQGSTIVDLLLRYPQAWEKVRGSVGPEAQALLQAVNLATGISTGAFLDQATDSSALAQLGATPVPSFAIACDATMESFEHFEGAYRAKFLAVCLTTPPDVLAEVFAVDSSPTRDDVCAQLRDLIASNPQHAQEVARLAVSTMVARRDMGKTEDELPEWSQRVLQAFAMAVFNGNVHDGALTQASAFGGLPEEHTATISGVVHSFAPCYESVQHEVVELLDGPLDRFCAEGFPSPTPSAEAEPVGAK